MNASLALWRHRLSVLRARWGGPRMVYGFRCADGRFLPHSRVGSTTVIDHPQRLDLADHVYIGHHNLIDASGGLAIGEGCQITSHVCILTHSSHQALRLHGRSYFGHSDPVGTVRGAVEIGACVFIGPHTVVAPGTRIGRGALVRAHSYVRGEVPAFAVMAPAQPGRPAVQVGDTREHDAALLAAHPALRGHYEAWAGDAGRGVVAAAGGATLWEADASRSGRR